MRACDVRQRNHADYEACIIDRAVFLFLSLSFPFFILSFYKADAAKEAATPSAETTAVETLAATEKKTYAGRLFSYMTKASNSEPGEWRESGKCNLELSPGAESLTVKKNKGGEEVVNDNVANVSLYHRTSPGTKKQK